MLQRLDRLLLHPWMQRLGSAAFVVGAVTFSVHAAANGVRDVGTWGAVGISLMAAGLALWVLRSLESRSSSDPHPSGTPIPSEHFGLLRELLSLAITAVEHDSRTTYAEETATSRTHEESFDAHFPNLAGQMNAWNVSLGSVSKAESDLGHRILQEASARGLCDEPYLMEPVVSFLRRTTIESVYAHREVIPQLDEKCWGDSVEVGGVKVAIMARGEEEDRDDHRARVLLAVSHVRDLLMTIQSWDEKKAVAQAYGHHLISTEKQALLTELRRLKKVETLFTAGDCPICRANGGELG